MKTTAAKTDARSGGLSPDTAGAALDRVGATASFLCAIHCALMPLVVTLLPLAGLAFLADERVEWALITLSAVLGVSSICLGYRRHRSRWALIVLSVGLALLVLGRIIHESSAEGILGVALLVAGGLVIAASHVINRRLCNSCTT